MVSSLACDVRTVCLRLSALKLQHEDDTLMQEVAQLIPNLVKVQHRYCNTFILHRLDNFGFA